MNYPELFEICHIEEWQHVEEGALPGARRTPGGAGVRGTLSQIVTKQGRFHMTNSY